MLFARRSRLCISLVAALFLAAPSLAVTLLPSGVGSIERFPELGIPDQVVPSNFTADYSKTTDTNRRIRRAFFEYAIGPDPVELALLQITFNATPTDTGVFELRAAEDPGDLLLTQADFDRSTILLDTVDPIAEAGPPGLNGITMLFDVTAAVNDSLGSNLAFQIRLQDDVAITAFTEIGYGMSSVFQDEGPPRLHLIPEPGTVLLLGLGLAGLGARRRMRR